MAQDVVVVIGAGGILVFDPTVTGSPWAAARRLKEIIFSRFPVKSPIVGLIWASAIFTVPV